MKHLTESNKQEIINQVLAERVNHEKRFLDLKKKQKEGLIIADRCANFLKNNYGVTKVVLFGSLLNYEQMNNNSDVDLAVWDLPEKDYFKAVGFLLEMSEDFSIDLVEVQNAKPYILDAINQDIEL